MDTHPVAAAVLTGGRWTETGRALAAKMLAEFLYEELLAADPVPADPGAYQVELPGGVAYRFRAARRLFDGWRVEEGSVVRRDGHGEDPATDPVRLLLDLRTTAGVTAATAAHLVRELRATQVADCHLAAGGATAAGLLELDHHEIEGEMGGHPWIAPNKGRLGFGYADYLRYAPERRAPVRLHWLAARAGVASYQAVPWLPHDRLLAGELDPATAGAFTATLAAAGADPGDYRWFPVHDWQWEHVVVPLFAPSLAAGDLLGPVPVELDLQLKLAAERLGTDRLAVAASALLEGYAWTLGLPLSAALATGAPAPDLAAANVRLAFADGRLDEVALRDPAPPPGGGPGAVARLVDGHLALLVARLAERRVRRGPRALWGLVANGCAAALLEEARLAGLPDERAGGLLDQLLESPGRSLPAPPLLRVAAGDAAHLVRRRVTCCLNYTVAAQPCATCPLLPPAETRRRLAAV